MADICADMRTLYMECDMYVKAAAAWKAAWCTLNVYEMNMDMCESAGTNRTMNFSRSCMLPCSPR